MGREDAAATAGNSLSARGEGWGEGDFLAIPIYRTDARTCKRKLA